MAKRLRFLIVLFRPLLWWLVSMVYIFAVVDEKAPLGILEQASAYYRGFENFRAIYNLTIKYPEEDIVRCDKTRITARGQQYRLSYDHKETITDGETVWV